MLQLAKFAGARVIVTSGRADNAGMSRELGADLVVNYQQDDTVRTVLDCSPGGVDVYWILRDPLRVQLLVDPLLQPDSSYRFGISRAWSERQPVERVRDPFVFGDLSRDKESGSQHQSSHRIT